MMTHMQTHTHLPDYKGSHCSLLQITMQEIVRGYSGDFSRQIMSEAQRPQKSSPEAAGTLQESSSAAAAAIEG